ncbi:SEC10/PgrA surface exclusion domain-containing protein [Lactobacillus sp. ESL0677]|uniref:SEC10/PgrA surface exclusion domain-containing protein n=1 Tax=Lactobacillus sp. ESL0677 TaxID=2983208 RepID=UPI0023F6E23E|nr:SEC10/PgrA surface exclusion domain-containing protein [Lactobacillus sp. ESL0677]WEV36788.1 SEC10/PgrA surface exclusion domain-containing protein [Lactobacillus sp. ESL0677]
MNYQGKKKLIKTFLRNNKKVTRNVLVGTAALGGMLGGLALTNNTVVNAAPKTTQTDVKKAKTASKTAKMIKKSYLYNSKGKKIGKKSLKKNKTIKVYGTKVIKGKTYYNLGNGKYVLASKVKIAQKVKVIKTSAIYSSKGKRIGKKSVKKGKTVKVYGTKTIKGKKYYSLGNGKYIPAKNSSTVNMTPAPAGNTTPSDSNTPASGNTSGSTTILGNGSTSGNTSGTTTPSGSSAPAGGNNSGTTSSNSNKPSNGSNSGTTPGDNNKPSNGNNSGSNKPSDNSKPSNGSNSGSTTPGDNNKPSNGSNSGSTTPGDNNKPSNGSNSGTTPGDNNKPSNGSNSGTTPGDNNKPSNGSNKPSDSNKPSNGNNSDNNKPSDGNKPGNSNNSGSNKPSDNNKPSNGNSSGSSKPSDGNKPSNGSNSGSATPGDNNKPGNGSNSGSTTPGNSDKPGNGNNSGTTMPSDNNKPGSGTTTPNKPNNSPKATIKLPAGYTRDELRKAYEGHTNAAFIKACQEGMKTNDFDSTDVIDEVGDDTTIVDPTNLTPEQAQKVISYTLRLINEARADVGLKPWIQSTGVQKLAEDIAAQYNAHGTSVFDGKHDIPGIVAACKENGLNTIKDNWIEDMTGWGYGSKQMSLSELKKHIYQGLTMMLFGRVNAETTPSNLQNCEWHHAGDLLGTMGSSSFDDEEFYFGLSVTRLDDPNNGTEYSIHYVHVSSYFINGADSNGNTFNPGKDADGKQIVVSNIGDSVAKKFSINDFRQELLKDINAERKNQGLAVLTDNSDYDNAVQEYVDQYHAYDDEVAHDIDYYLDQHNLEGYGGASGALSFDGSSVTTADAAFALLKKCLITDMKSIGIGAHVLDNGQIYVSYVYAD